MAAVPRGRLPQKREADKEMAEFKFFTIAASVTAIVIGAAAGSALGAISGGTPSPTGQAASPMAKTGAAEGGAKGTARPMQPADASQASPMGGTTVGKGSMGKPGVLHLQAMPAGTVRVWRNPVGRLEAQLNVYGLTPGSAHEVSIDGPASNALTPEVRFPPVTADGMGRADVTLTALNSVASLAGGSRFSIRLGTYPGPDASQNLLAEELIAGSGALPAHPRGTVSGLHSRSFGPTGGYLGRLHGWAKIAYSPGARTLSVTVTAYGLAPGAHAAHIHLGSCQAQGAVKYMLMDFVADSHGAIVNQTRTVTGLASAPPASGWYLNLHQGNSGDILAKGAPTLNFRPDLCANVTSVATVSKG
jgi:hypothetical protein